ncbi:MAG: TonB-dependent receptor [Opitutaceae bacterium]|nr:TonB-dependent receptor [Opitutaceae bacterium]
MSTSTVSRLAFALLAGASASAQTSPPPTAPSDQAVVMDPFDVTSVQSDRYQASNTISGTAMNTLLKDVPMSINVITAEFLNDAVIGDIERVLDFNSSVTQIARAEVSNQIGMFSLRGFRNRNTLLDGVVGGDFIPRYLVDRIEVVKGPNTLYGQSDPGGLVNMISKRPRGKDQTDLTFRFGSFNTFGGDIDVSLAQVAPGVGLRVIGSYDASDGYRALSEDRKSYLGAAIVEWKATKTTRLRVLASTTTKSGNPSNRGVLPFEIIPTDLNGDGDTLDRVGGVPEATARYNTTFAPEDFTSQTRNSEFTQEGDYFQINAQQSVGSLLDLQYNFMRSEQVNDVAFREFNTFDAAGNVVALYQATNNYNVVDAHTLNALMRFETGPFRHSLIAGVRRTMSKGIGDTFNLRPGTPAERAVLDALAVNGRVFRHTLTKSQLLAGAEVWKDDAPTRNEIRSAGFRANQSGWNHGQTETFYVSDSFTVFNDRLRILAGLRSIELQGWSYQLNGSGGAKRITRDVSHQIGVNYAFNKSLVAFANQATSYNPNGFDVDTNDYFPAEESEAIEVGLKLDGFWGGRISGSVAWFAIDKINVVRSDYNPFTFRNTTEISDDRSEGLDVELFLNLAKGWQTTVSYTHLNARTVSSKTEAIGMRLEGAAPDRLTFYTTYSIDSGALKGVRFGGGAIRAWGPIQQFGTSDSRLIREDGYTQVNLFARYTRQLFGRPTTFGLNVSNLTDEFYIRARGNSNTPREFLGSIHTKF